MKLNAIFVLLATSIILIFSTCSKEDDIDPNDSNLAETCSPNLIRPNLPSTWQPWDWDGYQKFPSLYFAAEPEGFMSAAQMEKVSKFSLAILEFRMGNL